MKDPSEDALKYERDVINRAVDNVFNATSEIFQRYDQSELYGPYPLFERIMPAIIVAGAILSAGLWIVDAMTISAELIADRIEAKAEAPEAKPWLA
jgi:hypothetical protein